MTLERRDAANEFKSEDLAPLFSVFSSYSIKIWDINRFNFYNFHRLDYGWSTQGKSKDAREFFGLGGHLKARCVQPGEDMVPPGEQGADYRTLFRRSCDQPEVGKVVTLHNWGVGSDQPNKFITGWFLMVSPSILEPNDEIGMGPSWKLLTNKAGGRSSLPPPTMLAVFCRSGKE